MDRQTIAQFLGIKNDLASTGTTSLWLLDCFAQLPPALLMHGIWPRSLRVFPRLTLLLFRIILLLIAFSLSVQRLMASRLYLIVSFLCVLYVLCLCMVYLASLITFDLNFRFYIKEVLLWVSSAL